MSTRLQTLGKLEAKVVCQYVWGARQGHRDELILRDREAANSSSESSGEFLNERLWCLMDYYDPTSIVDNGANVVERYRFSAFGQRSILAPDFSPLDASGYDWAFAFKGQFMDLDTGYYNYGYRYYSPELGRWLSRDPIGESGGYNLYVACLNNALNRVDKFGLVVEYIYTGDQVIDGSKISNAELGYVTNSAGIGQARSQVLQYIAQLKAEKEYVATPSVGSSHCKNAKNLPTFYVRVSSGIIRAQGGTKSEGVLVTDQISNMVLTHEKDHIAVGQAWVSKLWGKFDQFVTNYVSEPFCTRENALNAMINDIEAAYQKNFAAESRVGASYGAAHNATGGPRKDGDQWRWEGSGPAWADLVLEKIDFEAGALKFSKQKGDCTP